MKLFHLLTLFSFCAVLCFSSCGSDSSNASNAETTGSEAAQPPAPDASVVTPNTGSDAASGLPGGSLQAPTTTQPAAAQPAAAASGMQHYICPKNCKGSGGPAQANCPVCGTAYVHNQAFHGAAGAAPTTAPTTAPAGSNPAAAAPPPSPEKNAAGVYHYTCPKGCAGGGGAAGKCAKCGGDLAHNQAYHN